MDLLVTNRNLPPWLAPLRQCLRLLVLLALGSPVGTGSGQSVAFPQPDLLTDRQGLPQAFVPALVQDRQGFIWAATRDGLCRYDGQRFKVFQPSTDGRPSLSFAGVNLLTLDHHGRIWVLSELWDLDLFDPRTERFSSISRRSAYRKAMGPYKPFFLRIDRRDRLWIVPGNFRAVIRLDLKTGQFKRFYEQPDSVPPGRRTVCTDVVEDPDGRIWLATNRGLRYLDERTDQFQRYRPPDLPTAWTDSVFQRPLSRLFSSPSGELLLIAGPQLIRLQPRTGQTRAYPLPTDAPDWLTMNFASDSRGAVYFSGGRSLVRFSDPNGVEVVAQRSTDRPLERGTRLWLDRSDVLWEGTAGAGIRKYDLRAMPFQTAPYQRSFHDDLLTAPWFDIPPARRIPSQRKNSYDFRYTLDGQQDFWFNAGSSRIGRIDLKAKTLTERPLPVSFQNGEFGDVPCPLATDPQGRVWALYDSLAWTYDERQARWRVFPHPIPRAKTNLVLLFSVDEQALWLATDQRGLWRLDRRTGQMRQYANRPGDPSSLSNDALFSFAQDPDDPNRLWLGTFGSGLCAFDKRSGTFRRFTQREGLPNNVIYSVIPDGQGYLWMGTNKGICRMNRRTFACVNYTRDDGLLADEFNRFHWLHLPDDRIIMGGLEGITAFYPRQLSQDAYEPPVELTSLRVNNQPLDSLRPLPVQATQTLTFAHDQNYLTADFTVMQFNRPTKNRYRYRLEGLDDGQWTETDRPQAVYTALPPGHYTLWLNASNTSGHWSRHVRKLDIEIKPPFWATWWAYLLYGLGAVALGVAGLRSYANRLRLRQSLAWQEREIALKRQEAEQLRGVNQMKSNFFANITHEFRTPLTLILGPTEQMVGEEPTPKNRRRLLSIEQNAHQLLRLINQLLDLSKLEASVMPVHESPGMPGECIAHWVQPLAEGATAQGLALTFRSEAEGSYFFDAEKLERIVYNLTANALKFTRTGGIAVTLRPAPGGLTLSVADTGIGIPAAHLPHVFDRYYQVETSGAEAPQQPGTGIGLALVKELVELQGGRISVTSTVGVGTTFVVELPYRRAAPQLVAMERNTAMPPESEGWTSAEDDTPRILVVEDTDELAAFIVESLPAPYRVRRAANGREGLEQVLEHQPDLVISDVLMPELGGFTLCERLKTDLRSSHIPVILLTAKASVENRMEGLALGADDYLTKPFRVQELQLRVRNLLAGRQRLREWVRNSLTNPAPQEPAPTPPDPFLTRLYELMDAHLDDTAFGVERMMGELGLSRTNLFRKVKSLTGLAANDLLRTYRLKRAAQLLHEGHAVAETAYRVGFDSPAYFSKCFREQYHLSPREFAAKG